MGLEQHDTWLGCTACGKHKYLQRNRRFPRRVVVVVGSYGNVKVKGIIKKRNDTGIRLR